MSKFLYDPMSPPSSPLIVYPCTLIRIPFFRNVLSGWGSHSTNTRGISDCSFWSGIDHLYNDFMQSRVSASRPV